MPELLTLPKTRPGGRHQIGTVGGFISEWWAASNRNARADCVGIYTLGIMPTKKYQNEGGPGIANIVELLRTHSSSRAEDIQAFIDAIAFNWLIAGPDAHAKNYSLLLSGGPRVRLAPLYDIASILPYDKIDLQKVKLSMKIGGDYRLRDIGLSEWKKLAREVHLDADMLIGRIAAMAVRLPDELSVAKARAQSEGLNAPIIEHLTGKLTERAVACGKLLAAKAGGTAS